ncbi:N-acetylmuramoyl-L-alanine amidase [Desulfofundulus thermobenzoicus]|nr:N-acetylmuramoyl-L-alanine amidase [Desulfofundulus thermobenzoicus]
MKIKKICPGLCRRAAICLTAGFLCFSAPSWSPAEGVPEVVFKVGETNYTVNGETFSMAGATPFIEQGRTFVPVRYLARALGISEENIQWDGKNRTVVITGSKATIQLMVGSKTCKVNGQDREMDVSPLIRGDRTYLPARYVADALGYGVDYNGQDRSVYLKLAGSPPDAQQPVPAGTRVEVTGSVVNVRSGPGVDHEILARVSRGDRLPVLGKVPEWYQVQLPGGTRGWIIATYVQEVTGQPDQGGIKPGEDPSRGLPGEGRPEPGNNGSGENPGGGTPGQQPGNGGSGSGTPGQQPGNGGSGGGTPGQQPGNGGSGGGTPGQQPGNEDQQGPAVTSLNVTTEGKYTRVKAMAEGAMDYHVFRLSSPDRLVVDLTGVRPGEHLSSPVTVNSAAVQQLRVGWFGRSPNITRLVFEVKGPVRYRATMSADRKTLELQLFIPDAGDVLRDTLIAVDAGHGGEDPGAIGNGLQEKDITLKLARRLADMLSAKGARPLLTRSDDSTVGLYDRPQMANQAGADLFVSIHINANTDASVRGTATYILSPAGGGDPARREESRKLAEKIQANLVKNLGLEDDGVREANFAVLRESTMPAVLVEVAFISNPQEAALLNQESFREKACQAIFQGIVDYLTGRWGSGGGN